MSVANLNTVKSNDIVCRSATLGSLAFPLTAANPVTGFESVNLGNSIQAVTIGGSQWNFANRSTLSKYIRVDNTVYLYGQIQFPQGTTGGSRDLTFRLQNLPYNPANGTAIGICTSMTQNFSDLNANSAIGTAANFDSSVAGQIDVALFRVEVATGAGNATPHIVNFSISYEIA